MPPTLPPVTFTPAALRIVAPATVATYALASAVLLVLGRCRLAATRRPAEVVAPARVLVLAARLNLLMAGVGALVVWLVIT